MLEVSRHMHTPAQLRSAPPPVSRFHSSINQQSKLHSSALVLSDDVSVPAGSLLSLKQTELLTSKRKWNEMTVGTGKETCHIAFTEPETLEKLQQVSTRVSGRLFGLYFQ